MRSVEQQTRQLVQWMGTNHSPDDAPVQDLSRFSVEELNAIIEKLHGAATDDVFVSVALSFLRFAKLRGVPHVDGWLVQISDNGVIRKWPGCGGMKYKPFVNALKACGLIEMTREKRQSSNGTGRPRTYLIRIQPELRTGATMSHEEALHWVAQSGRGVDNAGTEALSSENNMNTYRRSIPPSSSEEMRKTKGEAGQVRIQVEDRLTTRDRNSAPADASVINFWHAESARLDELFNGNTASTLTRPLTIAQRRAQMRQSSGPVDQMVTTVQISQRGDGHGRWPRRFRHWPGPRQDVEPTPALNSLMSPDTSIVSTRDESQHAHWSESHEYDGHSP